MVRLSFRGQCRKTDEKYDYQFWLSKGEERLKNWEFGYVNNKTLIFSSISGEIGQLHNSDAQKLERYLIDT